MQKKKVGKEEELDLSIGTLHMSSPGLGIRYLNLECDSKPLIAGHFKHSYTCPLYLSIYVVY